MGKRTYYYHRLADDLVASRQQDYQLPDDYQIFPQTSLSKGWERVVRPLGKLAGTIYTRLLRQVQIIGKEKLQAAAGQGFFIYGNHTQPFGDIVLPLSLLPCANYYAIGAQANWSIPILGKLVLPYFGLPVGSDLKQGAKLIQAVTKVIAAKKTVVIYPEAHVWPYYTKVRPFAETSMHFPVVLNAASFTMTTTYSRPRIGKRPHITVYVDGPFYPDQALPKKKAQEKLHAQVYATLQKRAALSNYQYCNYQKI